MEQHRPDRRKLTRARGWTLCCGLAGLLAGLCPGAVRAQVPQIHVEDMTFISSRGERNEIVLRAERAHFDTHKQVARLEVVRAELPGSEGGQGFEFSCDRGELDLATNDFFAEGRVEGRTDSGRKFSTPWVRYDHEQALLFTEAAVRITDGGTLLRGEGFRYELRERRFVVLNAATLVQEQ